jgi:hypothetical protein
MPCRCCDVRSGPYSACQGKPVALVFLSGTTLDRTKGKRQGSPRKLLGLSAPSNDFCFVMPLPLALPAKTMRSRD